MSSFDQPKAAKSCGNVKKEAKGGPSRKGATAATTSSTLRQKDGVVKDIKKKSDKENIVANKHKTWGECPVDLMASFLELVSAGKLNEALRLSTKILEHEPDNPLIKMYQESLGELMAVQKAEEKHGGDSEDEEQNTDNFLTFNKINGEQQSEDEASESESEEENEEDMDHGIAEDKFGDNSGKADSKGSKGYK